MKFLIIILIKFLENCFLMTFCLSLLIKFQIFFFFNYISYQITFFQYHFKILFFSYFICDSYIIIVFEIFVFFIQFQKKNFLLIQF